MFWCRYSLKRDRSMEPSIKFVVTESILKIRIRCCQLQPKQQKYFINIIHNQFCIFAIVIKVDNIAKNVLNGVQKSTFATCSIEIFCQSMPKCKFIPIKLLVVVYEK